MKMVEELMIDVQKARQSLQDLESRIGNEIGYKPGVVQQKLAALEHNMVCFYLHNVAFGKALIVPF